MKSKLLHNATVSAGEHGKSETFWLHAAKMIDVVDRGMQLGMIATRPRAHGASG